MKTLFPSLTLVLLLGACEPTADGMQGRTGDGGPTLYYGGDILTMEGDTPHYAEAVVVQGGRIAFVGAKAEAEERFADAKRVDLAGKILLPGFIDAHGHAWITGFQALAANLLPPPDGPGSTIPALIEEVERWKAHNEGAIGRVGWIIGFGYDDAQLEERRHPTAAELDAISTEYPVLVIHQSGHLAVMNHKALELSGYTAATPNPKGGIIQRVAGSQEPNGVLEEMAFFQPVFRIFASLDQEANEKLALAGLAAYARFGFTTAQEGRATAANVETWRSLASEGALMIDVAAYPDVQNQMDYVKDVGVQQDYTNGFRVAGVKISLDGSPQGKTAWLTEPYVVPPAGTDPDYRGYPAFPNEADAVALIDSTYKYGWQILAHCSGDAASDAFIRAIRHATDQYGMDDRRSVMIHAQTVREDQLDSMKVLGIIPSYFGMHTFYWGDWHRDETLGRDRAYRISPAQSTLQRGMIFTEHHDAPVALPNSIMILHTAVNRTSRSGDVIGPDQRVSPYIALKAITDWAAYQYFEEDHKGTITEGKLADLVILDRNPLKVAPSEIMNIQVVETIKEGSHVYMASTEQ
jgi:predicted amidohydrolase YtcJ